MEKGSETQQREKQPEWVEQATKKWREMEWGERQFWLALVADEQKLARLRFVITYKHFGFEKIPTEYQKILAQKWKLTE